MPTNRQLEPEEAAFTRMVHAVFMREVDLSFEDAVREYRQVEAEFVERAGDNEWDILETRRRISEWLLRLALRAEQPHAVCRQMWEELVQWGFSNDQQKHIFSAIYARCCQQNGEFEVGIAVLEPLIVELEEQLQSTQLDPGVRALGEQLLPTHRKIRDELEAGIRE